MAHCDGVRDPTGIESELEKPRCRGAIDVSGPEPAMWKPYCGIISEDTPEDKHTDVRSPEPAMWKPHCGISAADRYASVRSPMETIIGYIRDFTSKYR